MGLGEEKKDEMEKDKRMSSINYRWLEKSDRAFSSKIKVLYPSIYNAHVKLIFLRLLTKFK